MANLKHVEIVRQGRDAIAKWQELNPESRLDLNRANLIGADLSDADLSGANLSGANLSGANLSDADLSDADLSEANLSGADLSRANLSEANLIGANLNRANLSGADLGGANLSRADLSEANLIGANLNRANLSGADLGGANLSGANLSGANLGGAKLIGADLRGAEIGWTSFGNVDLSVALNLDKVVHEGPCTVGVDTIFRSGGKIPDSFLRGCGVPDILLTFLPSLVGPGIEFYSSFISYSHKDEEFARRLHARMQQEKLRVWFAPEDIEGGKKLHEQIESAIRVHDKLLIVISEHSMNSEWVKSEIAGARNREAVEGKQVLFPVRMVDMDAIKAWKCFDADIGKDSAREIREYYIPDFTNWKDHDAFEREFAKLLNGMRNPRKTNQREGKE